MNNHTIDGGSFKEQVDLMHVYCFAEGLPSLSKLLWLELLRLNESCGWSEWFPVRTDSIQDILGVCRTKAKSYRTSLVRSGLLDYEPGKKGRPGMYRIHALTDEDGRVRPSGNSVGTVLRHVDNNAENSKESLEVEQNSGQNCGHNCGQYITTKYFNDFCGSENLQKSLKDAEKSQKSSEVQNSGHNCGQNSGHIVTTIFENSNSESMTDSQMADKNSPDGAESSELSCVPTTPITSSIAESAKTNSSMCINTSYITNYSFLEKGGVGGKTSFADDQVSMLSPVDDKESVSRVVELWNSLKRGSMQSVVKVTDRRRSSIARQCLRIGVDSVLLAVRNTAKAQESARFRIGIETLMRDEIIDKAVDGDFSDLKADPGKTPYGEFRNVYLTDDEVDRINDKWPSRFNAIVAKLGGYKAAKNVRYKSDYAAICNWVADEILKQEERGGLTAWLDDPPPKPEAEFQDGFGNVVGPAFPLD